MSAEDHVEEFFNYYQTTGMDRSERVEGMRSLLRTHPEIVDDPRVYHTNTLAIMYTNFLKLSDGLAQVFYAAISDSNIPNKQRTLDRFDTLDRVFRLRPKQTGFE